MDELFDIFDAVSSLDDFTDLTDHADTLLTALDGLDYVNFDADDLMGLDDLATFGADDVGSVVDSFDSGGALDSDSFTDGEWGSFDTIDPADAEDFDSEQFVADELGDYPDHLLSGLDGPPEYQPDLDPEDPSCAGWWDPDGKIKLIDHSDSLPLTLHHEMAHELMAGNPDLLEEITPHMANSPMLDRLELNWDGYTSEQRPIEFAAETFAYFKTKPELLQQLDPALYQTWSNCWENLTSVA